MALPNQLINTPEDQNEIPRAGMSLMARPQLESGGQQCGLRLLKAALATNSAPMKETGRAPDNG
jgi:hypothetical protein